MADSNIHEAIKAVSRGAVTDDDLHAVLSLRETTVEIAGRSYDLGQIAGVIEGAHALARNRWGFEWTLEDGGKTSNRIAERERAERDRTL